MLVVHQMMRESESISHTASTNVRGHVRMRARTHDRGGRMAVRWPSYVGMRLCKIHGTVVPLWCVVQL